MGFFEGGLGVGFGFGFGVGGGGGSGGRWDGGCLGGVFGWFVGGMGEVGVFGVVVAIGFSVEAADLGGFFVPIGAYVFVGVVFVASWFAAFWFLRALVDEQVFVFLINLGDNTSTT